MALCLPRALGAGPLVQQALRAAPALGQLCAGALASSHAPGSCAAGLSHLWDPRRPLPPPLPPAAARGFASASAWRQQREQPPSPAAAAAATAAAEELQTCSSSSMDGALGAAPVPEMPAEAVAAAAGDAAGGVGGGSGWQNDPADCDICETVPKYLDAEATEAMAQLQLGRHRGGSLRLLPAANSTHEQVGAAAAAAAAGLATAAAAARVTCWPAQAAPRSLPLAACGAPTHPHQRLLMVAPPLDHLLQRGRRCSRRMRTTWAAR